MSNLQTSVLTLRSFVSLHFTQKFACGCRSAAMAGKKSRISSFLRHFMHRDILPFDVFLCGFNIEKNKAGSSDK